MGNLVCQLSEKWWAVHVVPCTVPFESNTIRSVRFAILFNMAEHPVRSTWQRTNRWSECTFSLPNLLCSDVLLAGQRFSFCLSGGRTVCHLNELGETNKRHQDTDHPSDYLLLLLLCHFYNKKRGLAEYVKLCLTPRFTGEVVWAALQTGASVNSQKQSETHSHSLWNDCILTRLHY